MQVTTFSPSARLAAWVDRFVVVESRDEVTRVLLPDRGAIVGVRYSGAATLLEGERATRIAGSAFTGVLGAARRMRTHAGGGIVLAHFKPSGAAAFVRAPLHELFGRTIELDAIVATSDVRRIEERIADAPAHAKRVALFEDFLLERLSPDEGDPVATAAATAIAAARGSLRIATLARELGISQDPLEKRFRRAVGTSPKQLASIFRLHHALDLARKGASWSRVAHEAGYFDQSHLIREFRAITGDAPARFFRSAEHC